MVRISGGVRKAGRAENPFYHASGSGISGAAFTYPWLSDGTLCARKASGSKASGGGSGRSPRMLGIWEPAGICICGDACKGEGTDHQRSRPWD